MSQPNSIAELQLLWVVGALERLATLGIVTEGPYKVSPGSIELFLEINEKTVLNQIFPRDEDIVSLFKVMTRAEIQEQSKQLGLPAPDISDSELEAVGRFLVEYKNNPTELYKHALKKQLP